MQDFRKPRKVLLILFFLFATVAASSLPDSSWRKHDLPTLSPAHNLIPSRSSSSVDSPALQEESSITFPRKRATPNPGPLQYEYAFGWKVKYRQYYSFIIPIQVAASVLDQFLKDTLRRIALKQARGTAPPGNAFTLSVGSVFLAFRCADPDHVIEWRGVEIIVQSLLMNVQRGFTSQFRSEWLHEESGKLVFVSLSMLQKIAPGRVETGS